MTESGLTTAREREEFKALVQVRPGQPYRGDAVTDTDVVTPSPAWRRLLRTASAVAAAIVITAFPG